MQRSLFITGASGFVGSSLLRQMMPQRYAQVYCLCRQPPAWLTEWVAQHSNVHLLQGDLFAATVYQSALTTQTDVLHLAAVTGKADPAHFFTVNAQGTRFLVERCQVAGVRNFLYVSTIAVNYTNNGRYYYAAAKAQGEQAVIASELPYLIVRPTMVMGAGSSNLKGLANFVHPNLIITVGNGQAKIQPIYVTDLVDSLVALLEEEHLRNAIIELGGPEVLTFETFLRRWHAIRFQRPPRVILRLPKSALTRLLIGLEKRFYPQLPIYAGQLAAFDNDGTIQANPFHEQRRAQMKTVDEMLRISLADQRRQ